MSYEIHADYEQTFLLPPSLDDWVTQDHPARFVREFIDSLDLAALGFKVRESIDGRPNYSAELLSKIVIHGSLERIRSTRKLEKMCYNDIGTIWLTGMERPDHNTINRFLRHNKGPIGNLFIESVRLAADMGLIGLVLQAVDGTKIAADVSKKKTLNREHLKKILARLDSISEEILEQFEQNEESESGLEYRLPEDLSDKKSLREAIEKNISRLDDVGTNNLNPTDEDARMMKGGDGRKQFSYNAQAVVDDKSGVIVAADVVQDENDHHLLTEMIAQAEENIGETPQETVADKGYCSGEELARAEKAGYEILVNLPNNSSTKFGHITEEFDKSKFTYDPETDTYTCPKGSILAFQSYHQKPKQRYRRKRYRCKDYKNCPFRQQCSKDNQGRTVSRSNFEDKIIKQREKQILPKNKQKLLRRKTIVEPSFGIIKRIMGFRRFTVRGIQNAQAQWSLVCTAFNLRKLHRYWVYANQIP